MPDMLVQLLKLPPVGEFEATLNELRAQGVIIRRAHPFESTAIREFISTNFSVSRRNPPAGSVPRNSPR